MNRLSDLSKSDKAIIKVVMIVLMFIISMACLSCLGSKTVSEKSTAIKEVDKSEIKQDSSKVETVNKAIEDKAELKIQESNTGNANIDSLVNARVDAILSAVNFQKTSGDNSYKMYYDLLARTMKMEATIGETKDSETNTNKSEKTEQSFEQQTDEYFKKKVSMIPWWIWVLAAVFFWPSIWKFIRPIIKIAVSPASIGTELKKLVKDDNKD